jgi:hypothetical protein
MIRIDEIYENTFLPWVKNNLPTTAIYYHEPFGHSDPDSILCRPAAKEENSFIYFFDQEPLILDYHQRTLDSMDFRNMSRSTESHYVHRKPGIVIVSETNSDNIDYICKQRNLRPFYYFFHGWAALDWYRGYDRTFLITPWTKRTIKKTFFSANRIIGGLRQHRVLMLYHFKKLGLMHNWISASSVCPVENKPIGAIAEHYKKQCPDIVDVVNNMDLPRLFPGEDAPRMSSCWLDQFDLCAQSLVYHVTETVYTGRRSQLTEKSFKPIALGMPFVLSATAGSLAYLRSYGFQTFGDFWDESYDLETDDFARAEKVAAVLKKLDDLSDSDKQKLFESCWPVIEHNWNWFYRGGLESVLWDELSNMLESMKSYLTARLANGRSDYIFSTDQPRFDNIINYHSVWST